MSINKLNLFENLKEIRNLMNLKILICYKKLLLSFSRLWNNVGCLIIICIIVFHIIFTFVFYINQLNSIKKRIKSISFGIKNNNKINEANQKIK